MKLIGVDLGGSNVRVGVVKDETLIDVTAAKVNAQGTAEQVLAEITALLDKCMDDEVLAIGCGVPSVVDVDDGIVYDTINIPSWKEIPLKSWLQARYHRQVYINNDANCFTLGEKYFGKGKPYRSMVGLIVGTGLGAGLILNDHLYEGRNCGAGEFGMIPYLDHYLEYYASGQFFQNFHQTSGEQFYQLAQQGDAEALTVFNEFGRHFGRVIKTIVYAVDPEIIFLGGSVSKALPFFERAMRSEMQDLIFTRTLERLKIERSELEHIAVLGAAALYYDKK